MMASDTHEGDMINGYPWLGTSEWAATQADGIFYVWIGNVHVRAALQKKLMAQGVQFKTIKASGTYVSESAEMDSGCVLYTGVMVSADVKIGDGVLLNTYANIGHDTVLGSYTTVSPFVGVSGGCRIGTEVNIGGHAYLVPRRKDEDRATAAAGSIVFGNVKADVTVLGNPA